jgi:hypothetical protein
MTRGLSGARDRDSTVAPLQAAASPQHDVMALAVPALAPRRGWSYLGRRVRLPGSRAGRPSGAAAFKDTA